MSRAYYNEIDPYAAEWLRNLIAAGHIAPGDVDERSICEVTPADLAGYTQCHFFAGIGVWSHALRRAGWPDDLAVWTGSCPCQPFSTAGRRAGTEDPRHLWPVWFRLIAQCQPDIVFGEQVARAVSAGWLDAVSTDLEGADYALGAAVMGAHSVGAPHIRQRLYFMADHHGPRLGKFRGAQLLDGERATLGDDADGRSASVAVADAGSERRQQVGGSALGDEGADGRRSDGDHVAGRDGEAGILENAELPEGARLGSDRGTRIRQQDAAGFTGSGGCAGWWRSADWIGCADQKYRPVEPGSFPLANGATARVGRLRAYGNALVAENARAFIEAYGEIA
jgi:DNA (cytosine-5)-methyltransferase 1